MSHQKKWYRALAGFAVLTVACGVHALPPKYVFTPGDPSLKVWLLPDVAPAPKDNPTTPEKVALGKMLFFDTRFSRTGMMSCASCHHPMYGWSDGTTHGVGIYGQPTPRASLTVMNAGFIKSIMWDGRMPSLEEQVKAGFLNPDQNAVNYADMILFLKTTPGYPEAFKKAFPEDADPVSQESIMKSVAAFERTLISNNSPFDRWVKGDPQAMTPQQVKGFKWYVDENKGNCAACHAPPNFTDHGFHNIGVSTPKNRAKDPGRFKIVKLPAAKGAFKTPTLRDIDLTAPYMHDGSEETLDEVMAFYARHGDDKSNLDQEMKTIHLTLQEQKDIVAFMRALTTPQKPYENPILPPTRS